MFGVVAGLVWTCIALDNNKLISCIHFVSDAVNLAMV